MTNLNKLKVSLTKHGAHKVFPLMSHFEIDVVLENTWDKFAGIKVDKAQATKILSIDEAGNPPQLWKHAKVSGDKTLKALTMIGIIFSHHQIISALSASSKGNGKGRLAKARLPSTKVFTNLKNDIEELGYAVKSSTTSVSYDFFPMLSDEMLPKLATHLFELKLKQANWDQTNSVVDECLDNDFHSALGLSQQQFRDWLTSGSAKEISKDILPDLVDADEGSVLPFDFKPGHSPSKEGKAKSTGTAKKTTPALRHNEIQNALYRILVKAHGAPYVRTEQPTGSAGTFIDAVVNEAGNFTFFEIKTSPSAKKCIRQALSQLLEYAYWPDSNRAGKLVIVAEAKLTKDASKYLNFLEKEFGLPISYRQIDMAKETLS